MLLYFVEVSVLICGDHRIISQDLRSIDRIYLAVVIDISQHIGVFLMSDSYLETYHIIILINDEDNDLTLSDRSNDTVS